MKKVAIIGGGNLGASIAQGLAKSGWTTAENIIVTRRHLDRLAGLSAQGFRVGDDNLLAVRESQWIVLAVKPWQVLEVIRELVPVLVPGEHRLISVVTGITIAQMREACGPGVPLFRAMPNTAIAIQESMTCVAADKASGADRDLVLSLFQELGEAILIDEALMDAATVLGACGIAYALRYIRASSQGGIQIGFDSDTAQLIASQTVKGAAALLMANGQHPEHEIDKVTTPKGCTIAGLNEMEHEGFSSSLIKGILTSFKQI